MRDRSAFGYMEPHPDTPEFGQCRTCRLWLRKVKKCYWLRPQDHVDAADSCIMYGQGAPNDDPNAKPTGTFAPDVVGFYDGSVRCENCNARDFRDPTKPHCDFFVQLNRMLPKLFDLEERIKPRACCNAFDPGTRDPQQFGPIGPMADTDDGRVQQMVKRGMISDKQRAKMRK